MDSIRRSPLSFSWNARLRFDVLTLFPDLFDSYLTQSLLKKAIDAGLIEIERWNFRDWARNKHQSVDDKPYGGGPGMLLACQPVYDCVEHVQQQGSAPGQLVMLTPPTPARSATGERAGRPSAAGAAVRTL